MLTALKEGGVLHQGRGGRVSDSLDSLDKARRKDVMTALFARARSRESTFTRWTQKDRETSESHGDGIHGSDPHRVPWGPRRADSRPCPRQVAWLILLMSARYLTSGRGEACMQPLGLRIMFQLSRRQGVISPSSSGTGSNRCHSCPRRHILFDDHGGPIGCRSLS